MATNEDIIPLPPDMAAEDRILYRGMWITENRQPVELKWKRDAVLREIWVRLPSGMEKKWFTYEPEFGALGGHEVGALVAPRPDKPEYLIGMVNYTTDERRIFWVYDPPTGCTPLVLLLLCLPWAGGAGGTWGLVAWGAAFIVLLALWLRFVKTTTKTDADDVRRLDVLAAAKEAEAGVP